MVRDKKLNDKDDCPTMFSIEINQARAYLHIMAEESLRVSGMAVGAGDDLDDINKMLEQEEIADKAKAKKKAAADAAGKAQGGKEDEAAPAAKKKKAKKEKKEEAEGGEFEFAMEGGEGEEKAEFSPK